MSAFESHQSAVRRPHNLPSISQWTLAARTSRPLVRAQHGRATLSIDGK